MIYHFLILTKGTSFSKLIEEECDIALYFQNDIFSFHLLIKDASRLRIFWVNFFLLVIYVLTELTQSSLYSFLFTGWKKFTLTNDIGFSELIAEVWVRMWYCFLIVNGIILILVAVNNLRIFQVNFYVSWVYWVSIFFNFF